MGLFRAFALCFAVLFSVGIIIQPGPVWAQVELDPQDFTEWARLADRAEGVVEAGRASDTALEDMRGQLAGWRARFLIAQNTNSTRIDTLHSQLAGLGPAPETGSESEEIATRRSELNKLLSEARVPVLKAVEAHGRADSLIRQIDTIIRERQTDALLEPWPIPINPANWPVAYKSIRSTGHALNSEFSAAWDNSIQRQELRKKLPGTIVLLAISLVLLLRGRRWMDVLSVKLERRKTGPMRGWFVGFLTSLGQVVLPYLGVVAFAEAIYASGVVGLRGDIILTILPVAAFSFLVARWLGSRIFPKRGRETYYLNLLPTDRAKGRWIAGAMGLLMGAHLVFSRLWIFEDYSDAAISVAHFPLLALFAMLTFGLGRLLKRLQPQDTAESDGPTYKSRLIRGVGTATMVSAVVAIILGAIGYLNAADRLIYPVALTLGLLAFLLIMQRLVTEVYALFSGSRETAKEALVPVLIGFGLIVVSTPVLALIWGARISTLQEMWTKFTAGVTLGETTISPAAFITLAIIFVIGLTATRLIQAMLRNTVLPKTKIDTGGRNAIVSGIGYIGIFLAAIAAITGAGIDLSSLAIVAGALSVGIGFGLQNIVSNFVAGIILLIERPISEGDWIEVSGNSGYVRAISVRSTLIETFDRANVIVPNADLISGVVMNMTKGSLTGRVIVPVGVAYGNDTKHVESILMEIAQAHPMVVLNPPPAVIFQGFGADSLDFEIRAILRDVNWMLSVKSDMNHEISRRFQEENIEIPFAQRDIWIRNPEALSSGSAPAPTKPSSPAKVPAKRSGDAAEEIDFDQGGDISGDST